MSGQQSFAPVNRDRLYEKVAQQIQELIVAEGWPEGSKIPTERELGEQFGVSRTVIREALKALAERGLVAIRPGRGIFVANPGTGALTAPMLLYVQRNNLTYADLVEARRVLEIEVAGLAAERAQPEQIERLRTAIVAMDDCMNNPADFSRADQAFHLALAEATQNRMFPMFTESIAELLHETRRLMFGVVGAPVRGQAYHRALVAAVESRDAPAARRVMQEHIDQVSKDIRAAVQGGVLQPIGRDQAE